MNLNYLLLKLHISAGAKFYTYFIKIRHFCMRKGACSVCQLLCLLLLLQMVHCSQERHACLSDYQLSDGCESQERHVCLSDFQLSDGCESQERHACLSDYQLSDGCESQFSLWQRFSLFAINTSYRRSIIDVCPNSLKTMITPYWGCAVCVLIT